MISIQCVKCIPCVCACAGCIAHTQLNMYVRHKPMNAEESLPVFIVHPHTPLLSLAHPRPPLLAVALPSRPSILSSLSPSGSVLYGRLQGADVHTGQTEPGGGQLVGRAQAVVLKLDVQVEVSRVEEEESPTAHRTFGWCHLWWGGGREGQRGRGQEKIRMTEKRG